MNEATNLKNVRKPGTDSDSLVNSPTVKVKPALTKTSIADRPIFSVGPITIGESSENISLRIIKVDKIIKGDRAETIYLVEGTNFTTGKSQITKFSEKTLKNLKAKNSEVEVIEEKSMSDSSFALFFPQRPLVPGTIQPEAFPPSAEKFKIIKAPESIQPKAPMIHGPPDQVYIPEIGANTLRIPKLNNRGTLEHPKFEVIEKVVIDGVTKYKVKTHLSDNAEPTEEMLTKAEILQRVPAQFRARSPAR